MMKVIRFEASVNVDLRDTEEWVRIWGSQSGDRRGAEAFKARRAGTWIHFREVSDTPRRAGLSTLSLATHGPAGGYQSADLELSGMLWAGLALFSLNGSKRLNIKEKQCYLTGILATRRRMQEEPLEPRNSRERPCLKRRGKKKSHTYTISKS